MYGAVVAALCQLLKRAAGLFQQAAFFSPLNVGLSPRVLHLFCRRRPQREPSPHLDLSSFTAMKAKTQPPSLAQLLLRGLLGTGIVRRFSALAGGSEVVNDSAARRRFQHSDSDDDYHHGKDKVCVCV